MKPITFLAFSIRCRSIFALMSIFLIVGGLFGAPAFAGQDNARIKSVTFKLEGVYKKSTIRVISTNGVRWNAIEPGNISLSVDAKIDVRRGLGGEFRGNVVDAGLFLGTCSNSSCRSHPRMALWSNHEGDWSFRGEAIFNSSEIPYTRPGGGLPVVAYGDQIIAACNSYLDAGPRHKRQFTYPVQFTLSGNTMTGAFAASSGSNFRGGDVNRTTEIRLGVECVPHPSLSPSTGPTDVFLDIEVADGNACPRNTIVKTWIAYTHPKTAKFDIVRNGKTLKTVEIKAKRLSYSDGTAQWVIERIDKVEAKAGKNQFRIVVKDGGKSGFKVANIECASFDVLFSDLKYNVADGKACPTNVWETATFITTGPGHATMQVVQENGSVFYEKKLKTILKNGQYKLVGQRKLIIDKDTDRKFRVQIKGKSGIHSKWASLVVKCPNGINPKVKNKKNISAGATSKQTESKKPKRTNVDKKKPKRTNVDKKSKKKLICKGGKVKNEVCRCGKGKVAVKKGPNKFRCMKRKQ